MKIAGVIGAAALLCLVACSRNAELDPAATLAVTASAPQQLRVAQAKAENRPGNTLAYEHTVAIELGAALLADRMREIRTTCASRQESACVVLDVSFQSERGVPGGTVRLRMAPAAVDPVIAVAAKDGLVTFRNTHAEDLAEPVEDTERELSLLSAHRDRLTEFASRKGLPVDQVIALSKELASAQSQIDTLNTRKANLRRRIDTELLTITLSPPKGAYDEQRTPIQDALRSFRSDFVEAVAQVIRFIAVLLPWLVIIVPALILIRRFWRRSARKDAG